MTQLIEPELSREITLPAEKSNVALFLKENAIKFPDKRAVVQPLGMKGKGGIRYVHLTYKDLDELSDAYAHGLESIGIGKGTRTILMVKPCLDFFALIFAFFKTGAVPVVVDPGMGIMRMLSCLRESEANALVGIPPAHVLSFLFPKYFKKVEIYLTVGKRWFWGGPTLSGFGQFMGTPYPVTATDSKDLAAILFTTGSTGPAKGVEYTHEIFVSQVEILRSRFSFSEDEIDLPTFPLFALFDPALGITAIIPEMDPTKPAYVNPKKIIRAIEFNEVTTMFASPALLNRVGRYGKKKNCRLPSLKRVISAGAPVSAEIIERFSSLLPPDGEIYTGYGATEAMPVMVMDGTTIIKETKHLTDIGKGVCIGSPVREVEVRIIKLTDDPIIEWSNDLMVQRGEIGEITVKGKMVTKGYYKRPMDDAFSKIIDGDELVHRMGDVGWMDEKGRVFFCGRKSHRVINGASVYFTVCCEAIFNTHPSVFRSALVGVGEKGNQTPVIIIELESHRLRKKKLQMKEDLLSLAGTHAITRDIQTLLFHPGFPVDIRHNAKIFREKLSLWAKEQLQMRPKVVL